jgi:dTDP-4-dehydrorhamnose 3,5-epimerase
MIVEPQCFGDRRGFFMETYQRRRYRDGGITTDFVQDNQSLSVRGTLRGLHFQHPHAQAKLVQVVQGEIFDVAVDVRRGSPTFGRWFGTSLSETNHRQLYIPPGFAHGFYVLSEHALFQYKCSDYYYPQFEHGIIWNDEEIAIQWPNGTPLLSSRDASLPDLRRLPPDALPIYGEA